MRLVERVLSGACVAPPPVWLMRQAGRYLPEYRALRARYGGFLDLCYSPHGACAATLQPISRFDFDAAIIFSDILVVPHALGIPVEFTEAGPKLRRLETAQDCMSVSDTLDAAIIGKVYEALSLTRSKLSADKSLFGFAGAPWTLACYLCSGQGSQDYLPTRQMAYCAREAFAALIEKLTHAVTTYLIGQAKAGADCLQIFDSWSGILPKTEFDAWCFAPVQKIVAGVKAACPDTKLILFSRTDTATLMRLAQIDGLDGLSVSTSADMAVLAASAPKTLALQGNLDPILLACGGQCLQEETLKLKALAKTHPLIFNLGHGILPQTPIAHVAEMLEILRS